MDDAFFGAEGQTKVVLLKKTASLMKLHIDLIDLLEKGTLTLNDPHYARDGFLPHATVQKHARLHRGDVVAFTALSIIDMFPNENPYTRKVMKTIKISAK